MFPPQRPLPSVYISYGRHWPPFAVLGGFIPLPSAFYPTLPPPSISKDGDRFTAVVLLSWGPCLGLWMFLIALDAERWRSPAAGSGSAADAVSSQVQRFVRRGFGTIFRLASLCLHSA